jgi:energy-converting hydrogenase Eha subunit G
LYQKFWYKEAYRLYKEDYKIWGKEMKREQLMNGLSWVIIIVGGLGTLVFAVKYDLKSLLIYATGLIIGIISKILLVKNKS